MADRFGDLFNSRALYDVLAMFYDYPADPLFPRLIVRRTGHDIKSVIREIGRLENAGVVRAALGERGSVYRLDERFPLHRELAAVFRKTRASRQYT